jgi:RNA polymerase sigma-70 factor (ECF subfamily)
MEETDEQIVQAVLGGEPDRYEALIRRYNQRLYRVVRGVLGRDEAEIEDVMQQAYVNAYLHLGQFAGRASFSTWLSKIALYEALSRARRLGRTISLEDAVDNGVEEVITRVRTDTPDPERQALTGELRSALEGAIDELPPRYRTVFVLRELEGLSTGEAAEILGVREDVIKTRLHRARGMLRRDLFERVGASSSAALTFPAVRCDRMVARVFAAIKAPA